MEGSHICMRKNTLMLIVTCILFLIIPLSIAMLINDYKYSYRIFQQRKDIRNIYKIISTNITAINNEDFNASIVWEKYGIKRVNPWGYNYIIEKREDYFILKAPGSNSSIDENNILFDEEVLIIFINPK